MAKRRPIAVCTRCGAVRYDAASINQPCAIQLSVAGKLKRCPGCYGSALRSDDWEECSNCNGTGVSDNAPPGLRSPGDLRCVPCQGSGWLFVRKTP